MDAWGKQGELDKAVELLKQMRSDGVQADPICYNSLIFEHARHGQPDAALGIFRLMQEDCVAPDQATYDFAMNACSRTRPKQTEMCAELFCEMNQRKLGVGKHTWANVARCLGMAQARALFESYKLQPAAGGSGGSRSNTERTGARNGRGRGGGRGGERRAAITFGCAA